MILCSLIVHTEDTLQSLCQCLIAFWCFPNSRRSVSEVQLMHSVGLRKHIQQRQDWLQEHMQDIHTAPLHDGKISVERIVPKRWQSDAVRSDTQNGYVSGTLERQ